MCFWGHTWRSSPSLLRPAEGAGRGENRGSILEWTNTTISRKIGNWILSSLFIFLPTQAEILLAVAGTYIQTDWQWFHMTHMRSHPILLPQLVLTSSRKNKKAILSRAGCCNSVFYSSFFCTFVGCVVGGFVSFIRRITKKWQNGYPGNWMEDGSWPRIEPIDFWSGSE